MLLFFILCPNTQGLVARNYHPPFFNFLFTYLFSIKFLYFVIIKFRLFFPYFGLFVSVFIQSCVGSNYHDSILYYTINYSLRSQYQDMRTSRLGTQDDVAVVVRLRYCRPRCFFNVDFLSMGAVYKIK